MIMKIIKLRTHVIVIMKGRHQLLILITLFFALRCLSAKDKEERAQSSSGLLESDFDFDLKLASC